MKLVAYIFIFFIAKVTFGQVDTISQNKGEVYTIVDEMPEFPGGSLQMAKFILINSIYPITIKEKNIGGKVFLNFIVKEDGSLSNVKILKSSGNKQLDSEAIVMMSFMPKWKAGKQNGKEVSVLYNLPISYALATPYFVFNANNNDVIYLAAKVYIEQGSLNKALKELNKIENQNGLDVLYCKGIINYLLSKNDDACIYFNKVDELFGTDGGLIINNSKKNKEKYCSNLNK